MQLHLNEDRPPVNITSPGPMPIHLDIVHMFITRGEDGVFHIIPSKSSSMSTSSSTISGILSYGLRLFFSLLIKHYISRNEVV